MLVLNCPSSLSFNNANALGVFHCDYQAFQGVKLKRNLGRSQFAHTIYCNGDKSSTSGIPKKVFYDNLLV